MNANDMLDYSLGLLDGAALERFEQELAADPGSAARADRLTRAIDRLLDDGDDFTPPAGLAARTALFAFEGRRPRRSVLEFVPSSVPFRWADVAVAAGIFVAGLLTLMPALTRSRDRMNQAGCVSNLQRLGSALWQYGSIHHHYPRQPRGPPLGPDRHLRRHAQRQRRAPRPQHAELSLQQALDQPPAAPQARNRLPTHRPRSQPVRRDGPFRLCLQRRLLQADRGADPPHHLP